jgi:hypothetical protein
MARKIFFGIPLLFADPGITMFVHAAYKLSEQQCPLRFLPPIDCTFRDLLGRNLLSLSALVVGHFYIS